LLPGEVHPVETPLGTLRVLSFVGSEFAAIRRPLGPHPTITLLAAMRRLRRSRRDWDLLELGGVDHAGVDGGRTRNAFRGAGLRVRVEADRALHQVDFPPRPLSAWCDAPNHTPDTERRATLPFVGPPYCRSASANAGWCYERYRPAGEDAEDADPRWDLFADFERVLQSSASAAEFALLRIIKSAHAAAVRAGAVDLNLLYRAGRPVAAVYNYVVDGRLETVLAGAAAGDCRSRLLQVLWDELSADSRDRGDRTLTFSAHCQLSGIVQPTGAIHTSRLVHVPWTSLRARLMLGGVASLFRPRPPIWRALGDDPREHEAAHAGGVVSLLQPQPPLPSPLSSTSVVSSGRQLIRSGCRPEMPRDTYSSVGSRQNTPDAYFTP
jgi:hypothetical protein